MSQNFYWDGRERQYRNISPRIIVEKLLTDNLDISQKEIDLMIYDNSKALYHKRNLTIIFESGTIFDIQLDQGLGYWRLYESHKLSQRNVYFNAQKDFTSVSNGLADLQKFLVVSNGEPNPTNIYVKRREVSVVGNPPINNRS